jgi:hypothetical protein
VLEDFCDRDADVGVELVGEASDEQSYSAGHIPAMVNGKR